MANEITAELTDDQLKKFEIMKEHDMGIGDAIDLIFDLREELKLNNEELLEDRLSELNDKKKSLQEEMNKIDQELEVIDKLKDDSLDLSQKKEIIEKEYGALENSYEMKVQSVKRNINWGKELFKF